MKKIYIITTGLCNLKCSHCYIRNNFKENNINLIEDISDASKKLASFNPFSTYEWINKFMKYYNIKNNELEITLHGGEPMLAPIDKLINFRKCLMNITNFNITTNLTYELNSEIINFFKNTYDSGFNKPFIKTSFDYKIRFNEKNIIQWYENIKTLIQEGIEVQVNVCLTKLLIYEYPISTLFKILELAKVRYINFERLTENTTLDKTLIPTYKEIDNYLYDVFQLNQSSYDFIITNFDDLENSINKKFIGCRKRQCTKEILTIQANGKITTCPNLAYTNNSFSSIYEPVEKLYDSKIYENLVSCETKKPEKCYTCEYYIYCNGDCFQLKNETSGKECPFPKKTFTLLFEINNKVNNMKEKRKLSYLMQKNKSFNDNLEFNNATFINGLNKEEIIQQTVNYFYEGSLLIYPAKSYFVAIVYAYLMEKYFKIPFLYALNLSDLLNYDDVCFEPYKQQKKIYDGIIYRIKIMDKDKGLKVIETLNSTKTTIKYFKKEFLIKDDDNHNKEN